MQKILAVTALLSSVITANPGGVALGIDDSVIQNVKKVAVPAIIETINSIKFPEMHNDQGYIKDLTIHLNIPADYDINVGFDEKDNAVVLDMNHIKGEFKGKFSYWWLYMFPVWGDFTATIKNKGASIDTTTVVGSQKLKNTKDVLAINMKDFNLSLDSDDIDIELSGTLVADFIDFFVWMFKWIIVPIVVGDINSDVPTALTKAVNEGVASTNGLIDIDLSPIIGSKMVLGFDHSFTVHPKVSSEQLDLYLNGTIFDYNKGEFVPQKGNADLYLNPHTIRTLQIDLSAYVVDSVLSTLQKDQILNLTLTNDLFNGTFNLTTTTLNGLLPGLETKYGKDVPMSINVASDMDPLALFKPGELGGDDTMDLTFFVEK